jgi:hypothetical protein
MRVGRALTVLAAAAVSATVGPACASTTGNTATTFSVTGGTLAITVPTSTVNLGSASPGAQITAQLGTVQVTDARALLTAAWTSSVTSTSFTTGGGTGPETIANSSASYWSGPTTTTTGSGTFTPGQANSAAAVTLAASRTAFTLTAGAGDNSASWNPTLSISVPAAAVVGTYTGTVTHSVA